MHTYKKLILFQLIVILLAVPFAYSQGFISNATTAQQQKAVPSQPNIQVGCSRCGGGVLSLLCTQASCQRIPNCQFNLSSSILGRLFRLGSCTQKITTQPAIKPKAGNATQVITWPAPWPGRNVTQPLNLKNMSKYSFNNEVFLISDRDWRDVLQLVPVTTWTETNGQVTAYPTLIYHQEVIENELREVNLSSLIGGTIRVFTDNRRMVEGGIQNKNCTTRRGIRRESIITIGAEADPEIVHSGDSVNVSLTFKNCASVNRSLYDFSFFGFSAPHKNWGSLGPNETMTVNISMTVTIPVSSIFDADSIIHFMQQYSAGKATLVGNSPRGLDNLLLARPPVGANLTNSSITRINLSSYLSYLSYWERFNDVVYVEDNYKLAILASAYASLKNAPLVIKGTSLDNPEVFSGKNVVRVGNVSCPSGAVCNESYNLESLQRKYISLTNTHKAILVNPQDLNFSINEEFRTNRGDRPIQELYMGASLAAPILAAAKKELIIFYDHRMVDKIGDCNENDGITPIITDVSAKSVGIINSLFPNTPIVQAPTGGFTPIEYLTIIAAPNAIPDSEYYLCGDRKDQRLATDRLLLPGSKTGRIYSLTVSDVSSYIARSVFYDKVFYNTYGYGSNTGFIGVHSVRAGGNEDNWTTSDSLEIKRLTSPYGYDTRCLFHGLGVQGSTACEGLSPYINIPKEYFQKKQFIINSGHGNPDKWVNSLLTKDIPELDLSYAHAFSCSTAFFWSSSDMPNRADRFGARLIRQGAIGYHGLVGVGSSDPSQCPNCIPHTAFVALGRLLRGDVTLGDLDIYMSRTVAGYTHQGFNFYTLLGDPTLKMNFRQVPVWTTAG